MRTILVGCHVASLLAIVAVGCAVDSNGDLPWIGHKVSLALSITATLVGIAVAGLMIRQKGWCQVVGICSILLYIGIFLPLVI